MDNEIEKMTKKLSKMINLLVSSLELDVYGELGEGAEDIKSACASLVEFSGRECDLWFDNVAGMDVVKEMLTSGFIKPILYPNLFGSLARGMLLFGPPGTGKTMVLKAAVNELMAASACVRVLFFAPQSSALKGKYVGETETMILRLYRGASILASKRAELDSRAGIQSLAISIIFIDEIDNIAARGRGGSGEMAAIAGTSVNTLLQVMDGFGSKKNVITIGATNYPWKIDEAVMRRFTYLVPVKMPSAKDIAEILDIEYYNFQKTMRYEDLVSMYGNPPNEAKKRRGDDSGVGKDGFGCMSKTLSVCTEKKHRTDWRKLPIVRWIKENTSRESIAWLVDMMFKNKFSGSDVSRAFTIAAKTMGRRALADNRLVQIFEFRSKEAEDFFTNPPTLTSGDASEIIYFYKTVNPYKEDGVILTTTKEKKERRWVLDHFAQRFKKSDWHFDADLYTAIRANIAQLTFKHAVPQLLSRVNSDPKNTSSPADTNATMDMHFTTAYVPLISVKHAF